MKKTLKFIFPVFLLFVFLVLPITIFAQGSNDDYGATFSPVDTCASMSGIGKVFCVIQDLLGMALPILIGIGVAYFIWGVVQYVINDAEEAKTKGKDRIIFGIIGLAVIVGLWGLVNILVDTFFTGQSLNAPSLAPLTVETSTCNLENDPKFQDLLCYLTKIINDSVIPLIFTVAVLMFVWGTINFFIINADEEAKRAQGKQFMVWGIIALAVMVSVWGLVAILGATFGIDGSVLPQVKP